LQTHCFIIIIIIIIALTKLAAAAAAAAHGHRECLSPFFQFVKPALFERSGLLIWGGIG
jgi:hypothetical protein